MITANQELIHRIDVADVDDTTRCVATAAALRMPAAEAEAILAVIRAAEEKPDADLLAACEAVLEWIDAAGGPMSIGGRLRAAVNKAKGG
jgi:predicted transcriptional regulator